MEVKIYNQEGKESGKINLPESIFALPWNADLVHQVVTSMQSNERTPAAHTKDRSEVSGTGKKPWRQKGTGRARHGSRRSPIWRTGGVAHGPRNEKNLSKKINKKMRAKALFITLSAKLKDGEIIFVDKLNFSEPKTSDAKKVLASLSKIKGFENILSKKNNSAVLALNGRDKNTEKSFSNMGNIEIKEVRNLNPLDVLKHKYLFIENPKESLKSLEQRLQSQKSIKSIKSKEKENEKAK